MGYSQNRPIKRGGIIVYEKNGHGLVVAPSTLHPEWWDDAKIACDTLVLNGYSNWHLPTKKELNSLYTAFTAGKIELIIESDFRSDGYLQYWSSTDDCVKNYPCNRAWWQSFDTSGENGASPGQQDIHYKTKKFSVWCVRTF